MKIFFLFSFTLSVISVQAQRYNFRNYSLKDGLVQSQVSKIEDDDKGRIWLATLAGGVSIFDGSYFESFTQDEGLISNEITDLLFDSQGNIWVASLSGLSRYDGKKFDHYTSYGDFSFKNISLYSHTLVEDKQQHIWFGTDKAGIVRFDGKGFALFNGTNGFVDEKISATATDRNGNLWIITWEGKVYVYEGDAFKLVDTLDEYVYDIFFTSAGDAYLATNQGVLILQKGNFTPVEGPLSVLKGKKIYSILEDNKHRIWVGTQQGAYLMKGDELVHYAKHNGLTDLAVFDLHCDRDNSIWVATDGLGVFKFEGERFTYLTEKEGLQNQIVMGMTEDQSGNVWINTSAKGIIKYDGETFDRLTTEHGLSSDYVNTSFLAKDGTLWLGTSAGVTSIKEGTISQLLLGEGYSDDVVAINQDEQGDLWFGMYGALIKYNGKDTSRINLPASLVDVQFGVEAIYPMGNGKLLVSVDRKVLEYDGSSFRIFTHEGKLNAYSTSAIVADKKGNIWFSLLGGGVVRYNGEKFDYFDRSEGLSSEQVYILHIDRQENVWVGTEKGVDRIVFGDEGELLTVKNYGYEEGFIGIETNQNAVLERKDGQLWFGTIGGIMIYNANSDIPNSLEPVTYISEVKLFHKQIDWSQYTDSTSEWFEVPYNLVLPYNQNHLTINFNGVSLKNPEQVKYRFQLEPLEEDWSPATKVGEAVYTHIPPGTYTFKVKAANNEGLWNIEPVTFQFTIQAPFWQKWWFWVLVAGGLSASVIFYFRRKTHKLRKDKAVLEAKVKDRTIELEQQKEALEFAGMELRETLRELDMKNDKITKSINYASRIQESILPKISDLSQGFPDNFILYKPRDIVSGDFYWYAEIDERVFLAAVDCTGHGVPGAFMSMIGHSLLNQIVKEMRVKSPAEILSLLKSGVMKALNYDREGVNRPDSMDVALVTLDRNSNELFFSGAKRPLYLVVDGVLEEIKGDRMTVGYQRLGEASTFTEHRILLKEDTMVYLASDGFADQFGGKDNSKFMTGNFKKLLQKVADLPVVKQKMVLEQTLMDWIEGNVPQTDDIMVVGLFLKPKHRVQKSEPSKKDVKKGEVLI